MKIKLIQFAGLILAMSILFVGSVGCNENKSSDDNLDLTVNLPGTYGRSDVNYELATDSLLTEREMMLYKVNNSVVTDRSVASIGAQLGFVGSVGSIDRNSRLAMLNESEKEVTQLSVSINSGAIEYSIVYPDKLYPSYEPILPSTEEAAKIALSFLQESNLWPLDANSEDVKIEVGGTYGEENASTGESIEYPTHLLVMYNRSIQGYNVVGPGNSLAVRIGDGEEVVSVIKAWRDIDPYKNMSIISAEEAYQNLKTGSGTSIMPSDCITARIDKVELAYWMEPMDDIQEYVVPIYVFTGECLSGEGKVVGQYTGYSEAILE